MTADAARVQARQIVCFRSLASHNSGGVRKARVRKAPGACFACGDEVKNSLDEFWLTLLEFAQS